MTILLIFSLSGVYPKARPSNFCVLKVENILKTLTSTHKNLLKNEIREKVINKKRQGFCLLFIV